MLYTDNYWLISDNKSNDWSELHTFAQKNGLQKSDYYLTNGIPYYAIWSKKSRFNTLASGVIIISRAAMKQQLHRGKLRPPTLVQDFYPYKRHLKKWLTKLILHHGLKRKLKFIHTSIGIIATDKRAEALYSNPLGASILLELNNTYPEGRLSLVEEGNTVELEITEDIKKEIIERKRFKKLSK